MGPEANEVLVAGQEWRNIRGHNPLFYDMERQAACLPKTTKISLLFYPSKGGWLCWGLFPSTSNFNI